MLKTSGVLKRLYYSGELTPQTAKQVKEFFWSAVADLPREDHGEDQGFRPNEASALLLLQSYRSPAEEPEVGCRSEDAEMQMREDSENEDVPEGGEDFPNHPVECSFQSDTTVRLYADSQSVCDGFVEEEEDDPDDSEESRDGEDEEDDESGE